MCKCVCFLSRGAKSPFGGPKVFCILEDLLSYVAESVRRARGEWTFELIEKSQFPARKKRSGSITVLNL